MFGLYIAGASIYWYAVMASLVSGKVSGAALAVTVTINVLVEFLLIYGILHS